MKTTSSKGGVGKKVKVSIDVLKKHVVSNPGDIFIVGISIAIKKYFDSQVTTRAIAIIRKFKHLSINRIDCYRTVTSGQTVSDVPNNVRPECGSGVDQKTLSGPGEPRVIEP